METDISSNETETGALGLCTTTPTFEISWNVARILLPILVAKASIKLSGSPFISISISSATFE